MTDKNTASNIPGILLLRLNLAAEPAAVSEGRKIIARILMSTGFPDETVNNVSLVWAEAATNIITHLKPVASRLGIELTRLMDGLELVITNDGGNWNPVSMMYPGAWNERNQSPLNENGRGLEVIRLLTSSTAYVASESGGDHRLILKFESLSGRLAAKHILLVEDEPSQRLLFKHFLKETYEVFEFCSAEDALQRIHEVNPDIIISDKQLPGMDGFEFRSRIKADSKLDMVPFIFLTADADHTTRDYAASLGIDDFLLKPVSKSGLNNSVSRVLNRSRGLVSVLTERLDRQLTDSLRAPIPEKIRGFDVAVLNINAGIGGGDYIFHREFRSLDLLLMSDLMGHDLAARFYTYAHAGYLHGLLHGIQGPVATNDVVSCISDIFNTSGFFERTTLTMLAVSIMDGGNIELVSAGHPKPLLLADDSVNYLPVEGNLPGILPSQHYDVYPLKVMPGQKICIYSDGLFELSRDPDERERYQRHIEAILLDSCHQNVCDTVQILHHKIKQVAAGPMPDDVTVILLGYKDNLDE